MKIKSSALVPLIRLSQFNQWTYLVMAASMVTMIVAIVFLSLKETLPSSTSSPWFWAAPLLVTLPTLLIPAVATFLPGFMIFRSFAKLLNKFRKNEFVDLAAQVEIAIVKKYLWIQFALNGVMAFFGFSKPVMGPQPSQGPEFDSYVKTLDTLMQKAAPIFELSKWLTISLEHAMPLVYLLLIYVAIELNREGVRMRAELDDVV